MGASAVEDKAGGKPDIVLKDRSQESRSQETTFEVSLSRTKETISGVT